MRPVNARFDPETARKLAGKRRPTPHQVALKVGLLGCAEGPADLSSNKRYLYDYLARKYPQKLG